jgi:hypothetical protein
MRVIVARSNSFITAEKGNARRQERTLLIRFVLHCRSGWAFTFQLSLHSTETVERSSKLTTCDGSSIVALFPTLHTLFKSRAPK